MTLPKRQKLYTLLLASILGGCSMPSMDEWLPDRRIDYKKSSEAERDLEVPPDLTSSSIYDTMTIPGAGADSATYSTYMGQSQEAQESGTARSRTILPEVDQIEVRRDGDQRWLVIQALPQDIWPRTISFWQESGILLVEQDPVAGIMVTDWIENRADIKSDFITDAIRSVLAGIYSSATRDQFRVRVEPGVTPGTTELYLTQRGMEEQVISGVGGSSERNVWVPRPTDPGLEAAMLRRLMVYLGVSDQYASESLAKQGVRQQRSRLSQNRDQVSLQVNETTDRTWRLTGVALDRVGFAVEDRNRTRGVYYVRYNDPTQQDSDEGWLSKLAFWKDNANVDKENRYQVLLSPLGEITNITVLSESGQQQNSETAVRILTLLHEQLR